MKKILAIVTVLMAVFNVFALDDWKEFLALKTAEEFQAFSEISVPTYISRQILCTVYADALTNPDNYTTFQNYNDAFIEKSASFEGYKKGDKYALYKATFTPFPTPKLQALQVEAYNYLMTLSDVEVKYLYFYLIDDTFCNANNISSEDRFNTIISLILKYKYSTNDTNNMLKCLTNVSVDLDDDDVIKGFKKLYRKFYPTLTGEDDDPNFAKVTYIANTLKSFGYDVNK